VFHYTKSFASFARDYGIQEGSGLPALHEGVVPVAIVDEASGFVERTWPTYTVELTQAAVAAVYGIVSIQAGQNPVLIEYAEARPHATTDVFGITGTVDLRTANTGTLAPTGLSRGATLTAAALSGTTTVAPGAAAGWILMVSAGTAPAYKAPFNGLILRPGEYLTFGALIVNLLLTVGVRFTEFLYALPGPPTLQR